MKFIKKWGPWFVCLLLAVAMAAVCIIGLRSINEYKNVLNTQQSSIESMSSFIDNDVGPMIDCYVVNSSVRVGDKVTEDLLTPISIPEKIAYADKEVEVESTDEKGNTVITTETQRVLNVVTSINDIVDKEFRIDLDANSILSPDDVIDSRVDNTSRYHEMIVDDFPTDIMPGDYVDIRIRFTYGEDFIALPHKRIEKLDLRNGIFTIILNENELNIYDSMLLDKAMYDSTTIYMLKYVDNSSQSAAEGFYPVNKNVAEIIAANPNLTNLVEEAMKLEREQLNSIMGGDLDTFDSKKLTDVENEIRNISRDLSKSKNSSINERVKAEAKAAAEAAKANK